MKDVEYALNKLRFCQESLKRVTITPEAAEALQAYADFLREGWEKEIVRRLDSASWADAAGEPLEDVAKREVDEAAAKAGLKLGGYSSAKAHDEE